MRRFGWTGLGSGIGGALGTAAGIAMAGEVAVQFNQWLKKQPWYKPPGGKGGFLDSLIPDSFLPKIPKHPGGLLGALGVGKEKPPNRSGQNLRPATTLGTLAPTHAPHLTRRPPRAHGAVAHAAVAGSTRTTTRATASAASGHYTAPELAALWIQAGGPASVADTAAAIAIAESGGDPGIVNSIGATGLWQIHPGGPQYLPPMANARAAVAKYRAAGGFTPWTTYTGADTPGHAKTYQAFLGQSGMTGGATVAGVAAIARKRRVIPTAHLERGQSGVSSRGGARLPKVAPADRIGIEPGAFIAAPTQEQIDLLTGDPTTDPKARMVRQFQLGTRRNKILAALKSGRLRNPATRQRLLDELTGINSELGQLAQPIDTGATADAGDPNQPLIDAQNAAAEAAQALKASVDELRGSMDQQAKFAESVAATSAATATRLLADVLSGEVGSRIGQRQLTPGAGVRARY
jgi:hypothetical protein